MPRRTAIIERDTWQVWRVVDEAHRCSIDHCTAPAVAYRTAPYYPTKRNRRRYLCARHLADVRRFTRSGHVWWTVHPGEAPEDLRFPWKPQPKRETQ